MSELYNTWKGKGRKVSKASPPMIGMVYEGTNKFFGNKVVGVLVEMFDENDEVVLKTRENELVSVDKQSLKFKIDE
jgi:hypothetical protein